MSVLAESQKNFSPTLKPEISYLMNLLWDLKRMKRVMSELNLDEKKLPLGGISKEQIMKGYRILSELQRLF